MGGLCLVAACATERPARTATADSSTMPNDLIIVTGQTGGFAGRMRGYSIRADGRVWRWEGKHVEENVLAEATMPPEVVDSLWRRVQASDFFSQSQQVREERAFLSVTADGESRHVSWTATPIDSADTPIGQLYVYFRARAQDVLQQPSGEQ